MEDFGENSSHPKWNSGTKPDWPADLGLLLGLDNLCSGHELHLLTAFLSRLREERISK